MGPWFARAVSSMWKRPVLGSCHTHGSRHASSRTPACNRSYQRGSASRSIPCFVHVTRSDDVATPTRWTLPSSARETPV